MYTEKRMQELQFVPAKFHSCRWHCALPELVNLGKGVNLEIGFEQYFVLAPRSPTCPPNPLSNSPTTLRPSGQPEARLDSKTSFFATTALHYYHLLMMAIPCPATIYSAAPTDVPRSLKAQAASERHRVSRHKATAHSRA